MGWVQGQYALNEEVKAVSVATIPQVRIHRHTATSPQESCRITSLAIQALLSDNTTAWEMERATQNENYFNSEASWVQSLLYRIYFLLVID